MSFKKETFLRSLPREWIEVYSAITSLGFIPTLVGGTVRDFFLFDKLGADWDIELTHPKISFNKDYWKSFGKGLSSLGKVSYLPFEVIRLEFNQIHFEFSPPRKENFLNDWANLGHSNFEATFDWQMDFKEAVLRRDFTINAMGIRFTNKTSVEFLDPLNGQTHLLNKLLYPCGPDFQKDSVRFLRAFRFKRKLGLDFSQDLINILNLMPVTRLASHYLWEELQKSQLPKDMLYELLHFKKNDQELIHFIDRDKLLENWSEFSSALIDQTGHDYWMIALEWVNISSQEWQENFKLSKDQSVRLSRWVAQTKKMVTLRPESFQGEFEAILAHQDFNLVFDWYFTTKHLAQKKTTSQVLKLLDKKIPDWSFLFKVDMPVDVKHIDPPLRSKYQVWNLCQRL